MSEVCTKDRKHAYFGGGREGNIIETCPKCAQKTGNMHTSAGEERGTSSKHVRSVHKRQETCILRRGKRGEHTRNMSEVCIKDRKHAYFGGGRKGNSLETCPKCAQKTGNMHTSAGEVQGAAGGRKAAKEKDAAKERDGGEEENSIPVGGMEKETIWKNGRKLGD